MRRLVSVLIGVDITLASLIFGTRYQTISCVIGLSIKSGGWAARVNWPGVLRRHFAGSIYTTIV